MQTDLCLDEFTDHGHCGVLDERGRVDNDATLERYAAMALEQARAGSQLLGLSGMMDGQVAAVRDALDDGGHTDVAILAYSAKYASAFYGPFRDAVESTLEGDRRSYQLDPGNRREGLREALIDIDEGADVVMVKPAGGYLDVLADVAAASEIPVWAYQVSGEYSMIEAAATHGWIDRKRAVIESVRGHPPRRRRRRAHVLGHRACGVDPHGRRMSGTPTNAELFARAQAAIPGGVNSPVRAFRSVGGTPRFLVSARGAYVTDVEGREYVDLVAGWGPAILGHADPQVIEAVHGCRGPRPLIRRVDPGRDRARRARRAARRARREAAPRLDGHRGDDDGHPPRPRLHRPRPAREVRRPLPRPLRRPARRGGLRPRDVRAARLGGRARRRSPRSPSCVPYNDLDALRAVFAEHGDRIAAVITEAAAANMGVVPPAPGFNRAVVELAHAHGALVISDEVLTGFRVSAAGWWGLENALLSLPKGALRQAQRAPTRPTS